MRCQECGYELTDNERLLCMIPGGHYCPQCWAKIPLESGNAQSEPGKRAESSKRGIVRGISAGTKAGVASVTNFKESAKSAAHAAGLAVDEKARVDIDAELCKGCEFCVDVCPEECLAMSDLINSRGYRYARYEGDACTGCGVCYYNCPEPAAITVHKKTAGK